MTATAIAMVALAIPASATTPTTPVTLTITGGGLSISVPTTQVDLTVTANALGYATAATSLGALVVTDSRSVSPAGWNASANSTDFTAPSVTSIPASAISYTAGTLTLTAGSGEALTSNFSSGGNLSNNDVAVVTASNGVGDNIVTWNPQIVVTLPLTAISNVQYKATIMHSVL